MSGRIWVPIGSAGFPFRGIMDCNNKVVSCIEINKNSVPSLHFNYGFFGYVKDANIINLYLKGRLLFTITDYFPDQYLGGLAAQIFNSEITNCHSELEVCYDRERASNEKYTIYVGGLVGYSEHNTYENCSYKASLKAGIGGLSGAIQSNRSSYLKNSTLYLGGLCAYDSLSTIRYCSVEIDHFLINVEGSSNSVMSKRAAGLVSRSSHSSLHSCRSIIDSVIMMDRGSKSSTLSFHGVSDLPDNMSNPTSDGIYNCYSVVKNLEFIAGTSSSSVYYGGISASQFYESASYKFKSNYSNSNFQLNSFSMPFYMQYMGLTMFDSESMKTNSFCDELNLYYVLNGEEAKWTLIDNDYPVISNSSSSMGINEIYNSVKPDNSVYTIDGLNIMKNVTVEDINTLSPGVYIINRRKVIVGEK